MDFKATTIETQITAYLNLKLNSVSQFSVADFHFVKAGSTKRVLLV